MATQSVSAEACPSVVNKATHAHNNVHCDKKVAKCSREAEATAKGPVAVDKDSAEKRLTKFIRSRRMATIERDLVTQADHFLEKLFEEKVSEAEKLALGEWLSSQLEAERQGWKKKLQMSMKEIERERKMALEVHGAIHQMNAQLEIDGGTIQLYREPSMYQSADKDLKTSHIEQLQKNIDAAANMTRHLQEERIECLRVLHLVEDGQELAPIIQDRLDELQAEVAHLTKLLKDTENNLLADIEKLKLESKVTRDMNVSNEVELIKQKKTIQGLRDRLPRLDGGVHKCACADRALQVDVRVPTRECCIQTDIAVIPNVEKSPDAPTVMPTPVTEVKFTKVETTKRRNVMHLTNVGPEPLDRDALVDWEPVTPTPNTDRSINTLHKQIEKRASRFSKEADTKNVDQRQTIEYLRGQVVDFAHKLDNTKQQMEVYQRQLAFMRTTPRKAPKDNSSLAAPVPLQTDNVRRWSSEGFLSGIKKDVLEKEGEAVFIHSKFKKSPQHSKNSKIQVTGTGNGTSILATAQCLRCQKLYRLRDNHQGACMFHLKDKRKVERYDEAGKLLRMSMVWECCKKHPDSLGCALGQHV